MNKVYEKLQKACESVQDKLPYQPKVGLVLGSGLGDFADNVDIDGIIEYKDIEGFPVSTAPGHKGRFVFCTINGVKTVCMQGRVHYYEGYDITDVVLPIRLMGMMGADTIFLTNASGGIREDLSAGTLMIVTDHLMYFMPSPLRGENISELGVRFPDMSHIYNPELVSLIKETAKELNIPVSEGVYCQTAGPQYETPAEIRAIKMMGGDAVGMSTACEAVAANHMNMRVLCISCVCNLAAGISPTPLSEEEVLEAGAKMGPMFSKLVAEVIGKL